ncbi:MAG: ribonuclease N [Jatrophihabitans sp.]|nr:MAG: ribonuclease N [Jatrophihabitans sp.]
MRRFRRPQLALIALVTAVAIGYVVQAATSSEHHPAPASTSVTSSSVAPPTAAPGGSAVALSSLPAQVAQTVALIERGGPFPYPRSDGAVFHNAEHRLPAERDGYYHEYTVPTPGADTRGARRLITGAGGQFYYTPDHYEHFVRVDLTR